MNLSVLTSGVFSALSNKKGGEMKRILVTVLSVIAIATTTIAENFTIDTRIGMRPIGPNGLMFRVSRVEYKILPEISARAVYGVLNGVGFMGELNNFRIGVQGVYKMQIMDNKLLLEPFIGGSYTSSDIVSGSISSDFGLDAKYKLFDWLLPVVGADVQVYSDSYILDYYAGVSIPILNCVSLDLLYSALLTNDKHKIGAAGKINLYF